MSAGHNKRVIGLTLFSMGTGVLLVLIVPGWGFVLAALLIMIGFWHLVL